MRRLFGIILTSGVLLAGCGSNNEPSPPSAPPQHQFPNWPDKLDDFRFRWSAEPGTDLATGNAVPLRAYLESWLIISYTGDVETAYPGYLRATPEFVQPWSAAWLQLPHPQRQIRAFLGGDDDPNELIFGNEDLHILRIEPLDTGFRAFVCDATFRVYRQSSGSTSFAPLRKKLATTAARADSSNIDVWRVEFTDRDPAGGFVVAPGTRAAAAGTATRTAKRCVRPVVRHRRAGRGVLVGRRPSRAAGAQPRRGPTERRSAGRRRRNAAAVPRSLSPRRGATLHPCHHSARLPTTRGASPARLAGVTKS